MADQVVLVLFGADKPYAYRWTGDEPLNVGDRVLLPPNWRTDEPFVGRVVSLDGSGWRGNLVEILEKL